MVRSIVCAVALAGAASLAPGAPAAGQADGGLTLIVRGTWGTGIGGFDVESRNVPEIGFSHEMVPQFGGGATVALPLGFTRLSIRADLDVLARTQLEEGPGPELQEESTDPLWWATGSLAYTPGWLCGAVCASPSVGGGVARFGFEYDDLRDDIVADFVEPQTVGTVRLGLDLSIPAFGPSLRLQLADYIASVEVEDPNERAEPVHVLVIGLAWAWSPRGF